MGRVEIPSGFYDKCVENVVKPDGIEILVFMLI
jgi:hypothetical protein